MRMAKGSDLGKLGEKKGGEKEGHQRGQEKYNPDSARPGPRAIPTTEAAPPISNSKFRRWSVKGRQRPKPSSQK